MLEPRLEVDKARGQPKRSQTFGDGDPDFARKRVGDERGGHHAFDCRNNQRAFVGQEGAMDVVREQGGADLSFKIIDSPANDDGQFEPYRCGSETPATYYFQKNPGRVPIRKTADCDPMACLLRNAPYRHHTPT